MPITLEQARALDALAREGTFARAAAALHKRHTAVLYALRTLEEETGLVLLDRTGYRTRLSPAGTRVLERARVLLDAERAFDTACAEIRTGWEPRLAVVVDGVFPIEVLLDVVANVALAGSSTRLEVTSDYLDGVERTFDETAADMMIALVPPSGAAAGALRQRRLPPIPAHLVAHRTHPLAQSEGPLTPADLAHHVLLRVRGDDPRLSLSTHGLETRAAVRLADFHAKKAAILAGLGFGWLPEHLARAELDGGSLVPLRWRGGSAHAFEPRLYFRPGREKGRAARLLLAAVARGARPSALHGRADARVRLDEDAVVGRRGARRGRAARSR